MLILRAFRVLEADGLINMSLTQTVPMQSAYVTDSCPIGQSSNSSPPQIQGQMAWLSILGSIRARKTSCYDAFGFLTASDADIGLLPLLSSIQDLTFLAKLRKRGGIMTALEAARLLVLSKLGDGANEIKHNFTRADLPIGVSIEVLKLAVSGMVQGGSIQRGSGVVPLGNAGYLLHIVPSSRAR